MWWILELGVNCLYSQIIATGALRTSLLSLKAFARERLSQHKNTIGFNIAALRAYSRRLEEEGAAVPDAPQAVAPKPFRLGKRKELAML